MIAFAAVAVNTCRGMALIGWETDNSNAAVTFTCHANLGKTHRKLTPLLVMRGGKVIRFDARDVEFCFKNHCTCQKRYKCVLESVLEVPKPDHGKLLLRSTRLRGWSYVDKQGLEKFWLGKSQTLGALNLPPFASISVRL